MFSVHSSLGRRFRLALMCIAGAALLALMPAAAVADQVLSFKGLSQNKAVDTAKGESQLSLTVGTAVAGTVDFLFRNDGSNYLVVTDIYFDDGSNRVLQSITNIFAPSGVKFTADDVSRVAPDYLHRDELANPYFTPTPGLSADSNRPVLNNGIANNEWLKIRLALWPAATYSSVLQDLASGDLRVGIFTQGYKGRGAESFVNVAGNNHNGVNPAVAPTPAAFGGGVLLLAGLSIYLKLRGREHLAA